MRPHLDRPAAAFGIQPAMFPGGHIGFVDDAGRFVARLLEVLRQG